jgi:hypothetical protein
MVMGKRVIEIKAKNGTVYLYEDESIILPEIHTTG